MEPTVFLAQRNSDCNALAFVDVRMPPGWDGVRQRLGSSDNLLVLKKPFDIVEVLQIAHALTRKRDLARQARALLEDLDRKVAEHTGALEREMAERIRIEDNLRLSQKMEAVGQLAAGIAHDFNNLLTIIQGHVGLLISAPANGINPADFLKQVSIAADRAASLTRQLLVFSQKEVDILFTEMVMPNGLSRSHAVGQASCLSQTSRRQGSFKRIARALKVTE